VSHPSRGERSGEGASPWSGTPIRRHVKVQGDANPYDPAYEIYFAVT
jgi:hypothetical protein